MTSSHILGFPRIGANRELKKSVESYWQGKITKDELKNQGAILRKQNWQLQKDAGLSFVSVGDFAWYDQVLNTSLLLGVVPERFLTTQSAIDLNTYFCMARGKTPNGLEAAPSEMTKWFDTNYHYIVPEFSANQTFKITCEGLFNYIDEAASLGHSVKPVLVGPLTYLYLGKCRDTTVNKLDLLDNLLTAYTNILSRLEKQNAQWLQIDEPILTLDLDEEWRAAFKKAYQVLSKSRVKLLLTTYFGAVDQYWDLILQLPTAGLHVDLCAGSEQADLVISTYPSDRVLSLGVVNGRNIWKNDLSASLALLEKAKKRFHDNLWVGSSCSLLHTPVDLEGEKALNADIREWLAFSKQKVAEIALLAAVVSEGRESHQNAIVQSDRIVAKKAASTLIHNFSVENRIRSLTDNDAKRCSPFSVRKKVQADGLQLPLLPTTTIGSFPQIDKIRSVRHDFRSHKIGWDAYQAAIRAEIQLVIKQQEKLGLDVLVHGEPERNDMVEYFGELLQGFAFTENGWVQSYGSRCVKPPIIYGDVSRPQAMTVEWIRYAQSLTEKPVKGMLTGPATILAWSFVREDQALPKTALQIALALRDEVCDLEKAGISVIQMDEPAFREKVPLRNRDRQAYFDWSIHCFRIATSGVKDDTQIHTHMCYSDFNQIVQEIAALDADVITIESSRSDMELLEAFRAFEYPNDIGPGVYDIHSPRIPTQIEMRERIEQILTVIPMECVWVNPDCGLKTRQWDEVNEALTNMVSAARDLRSTVLEQQQKDASCHVRERN